MLEQVSQGAFRNHDQAFEAGTSASRRQFASASSKDDDFVPASLWAFVTPYLHRHRWSVLLAVCLNILPGFSIAFQMLAPKYLVDDILRPTDLPPMARLQRLGVLLAIYLVAACGLRMGCWFLSYKIFTRVREQMLFEMRADLFQRLSQLCLRFHSRHTSGELFSFVMGPPLNEIVIFLHNIVINVPNSVAAFLISGMWIFSGTGVCRWCSWYW
jgi:ABC-type multidrug transport system fused ATPase/permease subunit